MTHRRGSTSFGGAAHSTGETDRHNSTHVLVHSHYSTHTYKPDCQRAHNHTPLLSGWTSVHRTVDIHTYIRTVTAGGYTKLLLSTAHMYTQHPSEMINTYLNYANSVCMGLQTHFDWGLLFRALLCTLLRRGWSHTLFGTGFLRSSHFFS